MSHALYVQCKLHGGPKEWTLSFYSYDVSNTKYNTRENRGFAGRGSVLWRQCNTLCVSGFVDDVIFSHNARIKDDEYVLSSSPGGSTGSKVCRLWLHRVFLSSGFLFVYFQSIKFLLSYSLLAVLSNSAVSKPKHVYDVFDFVMFSIIKTLGNIKNLHFMIIRTKIRNTCIGSMGTMGTKFVLQRCFHWCYYFFIIF